MILQKYPDNIHRKSGASWIESHVSRSDVMGTRPRNRNQLRLAWIAALLTLICLLPGNAFGIDGGRPLSQLRLDTWSVRDGLPSRAITAIAQTPDGFLWLGTAAGLIRFDGISFDTYDTQNTPSLPGNMITVLTVTHDGKLWVGTEWGGFGQFADGKFLPAVPPDKHWSKITAIVEDTDGSLWVGGWGDAPVRHLVQGRLISYKNLQTPDPGVNAILPLGHGSVLCGMPWDTPRQLLPNGKIAKIWPALNISQTCSCLCQGNDGAIWWGNSQNGLYEIKGRQVRHFTTQDGLASNVVSSLYKDPSGNIWVGTTNGLSVWNGSLFQSFSKDGGLYDSAVGPILDDLEGNLWVAAGVGLNRFAATKLQPYTINRGGDTATLSDQCSLSPSPRGGMWCATNKGLWLLNARAQIFCDLGKHIDSHLAGVIGGPDGNLWVWNNDPGKPYTLLCISPKSGKGSQSVETALTAAARDSLQYHGLVISSSLFAAIPT
ncbi:MAG TPA: two-component regulator propeller domain-containing protein, partial [Capsulimonadaceae bacterium]|nr:two-component regulator propeller domain-containing protein [Capsulimonadaceae bacterium]